MHIHNTHNTHVYTLTQTHTPHTHTHIHTDTHTHSHTGGHTHTHTTQTHPHTHAPTRWHQARPRVGGWLLAITCEEGQTQAEAHSEAGGQVENDFLVKYGWSSSAGPDAGVTR